MLLIHAKDRVPRVKPLPPYGTPPLRAHFPFVPKASSELPFLGQPSWLGLICWRSLKFHSGELSVTSTSSVCSENAYGPDLTSLSLDSTLASAFIPTCCQQAVYPWVTHSTSLYSISSGEVSKLPCSFISTLRPVGRGPPRGLGEEKWPKPSGFLSFHHVPALLSVYAARGVLWGFEDTQHSPATTEENSVLILDSV